MLWGPLCNAISRCLWESELWCWDPEASSSSMLISGDFINVLCSPETDFVVVYTDFVRYCQKYWVCIHVAFRGRTAPAPVLTLTSDSEVQHPRTKRTTCHRSAWTTNTLQLRLATDSCALDTEESNRVSSGSSIDSLEILWFLLVSVVFLGKPY